MTALKNLNTNSMAQDQSLNRLSSGFRINSAADDSSGFAISSKLDAQAGRLKAASQNATQATAMVKMADAGVNEIQNMFNRILTLATQASSGNNAGELAKLDAERIKLETQIDNIANSTNYNGVSLLNGTSGSSATLAAPVAGISATVQATGAASGAVTLSTLTNAGGGIDITLTNAAGTAQTVNVTVPAAGTTSSVAFNDIGLTLSVDSNLVTGGAGTVNVTAGASSSFQVGADNAATNRVSINLSNSYTTASLFTGYGGVATAGLTTNTDAQNYIDKASFALDKLITQRADLGATQNQLGFVQANLATSIEQTTASVSAIKDADMAAEMANFTKNKILTQAGTSMLAQANQASQNVLTLFR
ncbi:flagellar protein [Mariprofundus ferrooxydans]|uniref:Flagellin n=2 Tax=Mariprofundus ferrooxydans TaxID=314344 RepID=Q0F278_9PROT|nr:flagellar protein [Mariprofundus ferrooxydans PV-1]KON48762.1 flagellar protein [Mariprofundus ferrooxydans]